MRLINSGFHSTREYESWRVYTETEAHPHKQLDSSSLANYYANLCSVPANGNTHSQSKLGHIVSPVHFGGFTSHAPEE